MVTLPINPLLKAPEIEHQLTDSGASIMLGLAGLHAEAAKACELAGLPLYLAGDLPPGMAARSPGELMSARPARSPGERMSARPLAEPGGEIWACNADDTAVLNYASGTTGKPKGAELTHFLLHMNCTVSGQLFGARPAASLILESYARSRVRITLEDHADRDSVRRAAMNRSWHRPCARRWCRR
jgi:long-chain acyl-CoA synthetase